VAVSAAINKRGLVTTLSSCLPKEGLSVSVVLASNVLLKFWLARFDASSANSKSVLGKERPFSSVCLFLIPLYLY